MPSAYPVPTEQSVEALLAGLVSVPAEVTRAQVDDPERDAPGVFAEWVTDDDELAVLGFADRDVVNVIGGVMIGADAETLAATNEKGALDPESVEGFREVVNVFASCLNSDFTKHLKLRNVQTLPGQLADDVKQLWREPRARRAYRVSAEDFGGGALILYFG
jgi:hypothetical protein